MRGICKTNKMNKAIRRYRPRITVSGPWRLCYIIMWMRGSAVLKTSLGRPLINVRSCALHGVDPSFETYRTIVMLDLELNLFLTQGQRVQMPCNAWCWFKSLTPLFLPSAFFLSFFFLVPKYPRSFLLSFSPLTCRQAAPNSPTMRQLPRLPH